MRLLLATTLALLLIRSATPASATCAVIGDSIAQGLRPSFRECGFAVQIGIGTAAITSRVPGNADVIVVTIISPQACSPVCRRCDPAPARRASSGSDQSTQVAAAAVDTVAQANGDAVVPFVVSPADRLRVHPQSSSTLAAEIRRHF
jgi:hypothetical protein